MTDGTPGRREWSRRGARLACLPMGESIAGGGDRLLCRGTPLTRHGDVHRRGV